MFCDGLVSHYWVKSLFLSKIFFFLHWFKIHCKLTDQLENLYLTCSDTHKRKCIPTVPLTYSILLSLIFFLIFSLCYSLTQSRTHTHTFLHTFKNIYVFNRDLVEKMPSSHTYLLLGDAYMYIQEVGFKWQYVIYVLHISFTCMACVLWIVRHNFPHYNICGLLSWVAQSGISGFEDLMFTTLSEHENVIS